MGLQSFERGLERMVDSVFARSSRNGLRPVELGRRLLREIDDHRTVDVRGRRLVPNAFTFHLSRHDLDAFAGIDQALKHELAEAARDYARDEGYHLVGPISVAFEVDQRAKPGRFTITSQVRESLVHQGAPPAERPVIDMSAPAAPAMHPPAAPAAPAVSAPAGVDRALDVAAVGNPALAALVNMVEPDVQAFAPAAPASDSAAPAPEAAAVPPAPAADAVASWASAEPTPEPAVEPAPAVGPEPADDTAPVIYGWLVLPSGRRVAVGNDVLTIGRMPDSSIVLADANVSRRHAEIRPGDHVMLVDLGSTNGTKVNNQLVDGAQALHDHDLITLGNTHLRYEVQ